MNHNRSKKTSWILPLNIFLAVLACFLLFRAFSALHGKYVSTLSSSTIQTATLKPLNLTVNQQETAMLLKGPKFDEILSAYDHGDNEKTVSSYQVVFGSWDEYKNVLTGQSWDNGVMVEADAEYPDADAAVDNSKYLSVIVACCG
jgi:hypothetical protein